MVKCRFTSKAVQDLSDIWEYTVEKWSEEQADKYYFLIYETCLWLASYPHLGRQYSEINPTIYGYTASKHLIFFERKRDNSILVVRIVHGSSDLRKYKSKLE